jgi:hypothetical protein
LIVEGDDILENEALDGSAMTPQRIVIFTATRAALRDDQRTRSTTRPRFAVLERCAHAW